MTNKGFTLLEVILALSIISVSLLGLIHAYVLIDHSRLETLFYTQALLLQEEKLHDILYQENAARLSEGTFAPPFDLFQWRAVQEKESKAGFRKVGLTISWVAGQQDKALTLSTYIRKKDDRQKKE